MTDFRVSLHAIERAIERGAASNEDAAVTLLSSPAIQAAAQFGARFVRLHTGHRVVIDEGTVVTVHPPDGYRRQVQRIGTTKFGKWGAKGKRPDRGDE